MEAFLQGLGERYRAEFGVSDGVNLDGLRAKLLDGPDRMVPGLVAACLRAGIGDPGLASEPLVSRRRFARFDELLSPDTPDEKHRRLLSNLLGREGAT